MQTRTPLLTCLALCFALCLPSLLPGQQEPLMPKALFDTLEWRCIGPYRGGRSAAVAGISSQRDTYYFGATGGGVWKTTDGGRTWKNVSDGSFGGSIGSVAVSEADPNVVYVGGGEVTVRGNVSSGDGMWKSTDAGKTWKHIGLPESRHIPRIRIHPKNPDLVYAAVLGHISGPNEDRGVYRSRDGGETWERTLFVSEEAGAVDLIMDPGNARILYASTWRVIRTPYNLESGGEGSGLWKSTDSGDTWKEITRNKGLPKGPVGIIGIAVSPVRTERIWAIVEAEDGGVFRSEDGGESWKLVNSERKLRQRAWYYSRIYADSKDEDLVYVLNVRFHRSKDGGRTFEKVPTPHSDNHDLWIDPNDPKRMIEANDGGANVSYDGGRSWSTQNNQPTAQFYRVTTDNHFPYRIYGAQQDNSTVRILSRSSRATIDERDWEPTAGGESGHIAPHPVDPEIVYGGSYGGYLARRNHRTDESRVVTVWPDEPIGWGARDLKYRFQWNFPIFFSPHDPDVLYAAANVLFQSTNEGQTWQAISPDLSRNHRPWLLPSGGPITKDNTGVEYYCTIFAAVESPLQKGLFWAGSDDGLVHVSTDGAASWDDVTPPSLPEQTQINSIEAHPFEKGGLYLAATRYKLDDFEPYLYRTKDYGTTWKRITKGIGGSEFTRVIRADPVRRGLLYAGTERGVHVSYDDGKNWQSLQLNLPITPVTDLAIKEGDLIAATQGRAFWVLDNLEHLRQCDPKTIDKDLCLFTPRPAYRMSGRSSENSLVAGKNPPAAVVLRFFLKEEPKENEEVSLEILEKDLDLVRRFSPKATAGMNRFEWNMLYEDAKTFEGMVLWGGQTSGPKAVPGKYVARLSVGKASTSTDFEILQDPRTQASQEDLQLQFDFLIEARDKLSEAHEAIIRIRETEKQIEAVLAKIAGDKSEAGKELREYGKDMVAEARSIEEALYQTKNESPQDPLNYPIRLNNKLAALASVVARGDYRPTDQATEVLDKLVMAIDDQMNRLAIIETSRLKQFNELARAKGIEHVSLKPAK